MGGQPGLSATDLSLLRGARTGMLAINAGRSPLVNPVAFHYAAGSVWMTTSRAAVKVSLLRRDPRGAFLVGARDRYLLLQGVLEHFDPRSISGQLRAVLNGPAFYLSLGGYAIKNAGFIGGYVLDVARIPRQWWPQNRVVLRMRPERAQWMAMEAPPSPGPAALPSAPIPLRRALSTVGVAHLCWSPDGRPTLSPALWSSRGPDPLVALPPGSLEEPAPPAAAALVVEAHHRFRATRMQGACVRGVLKADAGATAEVGERYGLGSDAFGSGFVLRAGRVTWWKGFEIATLRRDPGASA
ncbi:MAG: pyridoxamine 5'-phosphate oxidase family protein [Candidatus Dormibacteraceae bacterium]